MNEEWYRQLAESIAENKIDEVNNLIAEPYFDELLKDTVKCKNLLHIAGVEHNHSAILDNLLEKMSIHRHIASDIVADVCAKGHLEVVESLLRAGAFDVNSIRSQQALMLNACSSGNSKLVNFLINNGAIPDELALNAACAAGALDSVKLLINAGVEVNGFQSYYNEEHNPFSSAAESNHVEILNYLLQNHKVKLGEVIHLLPFICKADNPEMIKILLDNEINILSQNDVRYHENRTSYLQETLAVFCENDSITLLDHIIKTIGEFVVNMHLRNCNFNRPLHLASTFGYVDLLEKLLQYNPDICVVNYEGQTPLHSACMHNHIDIVQRLLVYGSNNPKFNINAIDDYGNTALHYALDSPDCIGIIHRLVAHGADININSPLIDAIRSRDKAVINAILNLSPDVNQKNSRYNFTALFAATETGQTEIVDRLLALGADVNRCYFTTDYASPLILAIEKGYVDIANALLDSGADVTKSDDFNSDALFLAVEKNFDIKIIHRILDAGAKVNWFDNGHHIDQPLLEAMENDNLDVVELLLNYVTNPNKSTIYRDRALVLAIKEEVNTAIISRLLTSGANVNRVDSEGFTPLMYAVQKNNIEVITLLLNQDSINSSKKNKDGFSAADMARSPEVRELINQHVKLSQDADLSQGSSSSSRPPF